MFGNGEGADVQYQNNTKLGIECLAWGQSNGLSAERFSPGKARNEDAVGSVRWLGETNLKVQGPRFPTGPGICYQFARRSCPPPNKQRTTAASCRGSLSIRLSGSEDERQYCCRHKAL